MWHASMHGLARGAALLVAAVGLGGCFQPLYGDARAPNAPTVRQALSHIEVVDISQPDGSPFVRMAVKVQNDLKFNFTGGAGAPVAPTHRLIIQLTGAQSVVNASSVAGYPIITNYAFNASYTLVEIAGNRRVLSGTTVSTVSYDPTGSQRFARLSGAEDAKLRAAKEIADNITTRMASFFVSGT